MSQSMGAPARQLLTVQPSCPICGRDAKSVGFNLVNCPMHGYTEKTPLVADRLRSGATVKIEETL